MPRLDGLSAMRAIRADPRLAGTKLVALRALAMPGDEERCRAAGADDYLRKPISPVALDTTIDRLSAERGR